MSRPDGRSVTELRPVKLSRGWLDHAEGSVLIECGDTRVVCTASVEEGVPAFLKGQGQGWLTAEYGMEIPVVMLVGYRGWTRHGGNTDSAATYTERFLHAFGITYYLVETSADAPRISIAFEEARRTQRPVAVLMADEYHGFNR